MSIGSIGSSSCQQYQPLTFDSADKDQDGSLSLDEFGAIGQNLPGGNNGLDANSIQKLFSAIDTDGDGKISKTEAKTAHDKLSSAVQSQLLGVQEQAGAKPPSLDDIFAKADADKNGSLSFDEFKAAAPKHGHHAHASSGANTQATDPLKDLFNSIDTDGDGTVSQNELASAFQNGSGAPSDSTASSTGSNDMLFAQAVSAYTNQSSSTDIVTQLLATLQTA